MLLEHLDFVQKFQENNVFYLPKEMSLQGLWKKLLNDQNILNIGEKSSLELCWFVEDLVDGSLLVKQLLGSSLKLILVVKSSQKITLDIQIETLEDNTKTEIFILNQSLEGGEINLNLKINHFGKKNLSKVLQKNIVFRNSNIKNFSGIQVNPTAFQTEAELAIRTLLVGDNSQVQVEPALKIYTDDLSCKHSATISNLNLNDLYYLLTRGLSKKQAKKLFLNSFSKEILKEISPIFLQEIHLK